jgi:hypothetical protein
VDPDTCGGGRNGGHRGELDLAPHHLTTWSPCDRLEVGVQGEDGRAWRGP